MKIDFWEKMNCTFGVLNIFTDQLCEKKNITFFGFTRPLRSPGFKHHIANRLVSERESDIIL